MTDVTPAEMAALLDRAAAMKAAPRAETPLAGRIVAMIFEKPSTRTRVSFEAGIAQLGGTPIVLSAAELQLGRGETIEDTGRVLGRYVDAIVARTFEQDRLTRLASSSGIPVVNALSDEEHPCQALADLLTMRERFGGLAGRRCAFVGDGNNVAHSLMLAGAMAGLTVAVATPPGYEPVEQIVKAASDLAAAGGGAIETTDDPAAAVSGA
ncbi:MAG: ornithine carbamoyltransferase, partial [Actinomycetota bacterium]